MLFRRRTVSQQIDRRDHGSLDLLIVEQRERVSKLEIGIFFSGEYFFVGAFLEPAPIIFHGFTDDFDFDAFDQGEVNVLIGFAFFDPQAKRGVERRPQLAVKSSVVVKCDCCRASRGGALGLSLWRNDFRRRRGGRFGGLHEVGDIIIRRGW